MKRERRPLIKPRGNYFTDDKPGIKFVSSGCTLLDCAIGGGYPLGRMVNIVGDKSTCKTALATEAITNFKLRYPKGLAAYRDTEAAFEEAYAEQMGLPPGVDFGEGALLTVENFFNDFDAFLTKCKGKQGIYVVDSLDALSDEAEMAREIDKSSYGTSKAKQLSVLFRKLVEKIEVSQVLLIIVSQVRDNIGAMMGEKQKRSGGHAMDFYASQIIWLAHIGQLKREINKVQRVYGISIRANCKKNKVGFPFRKADFDFLFGYGIEDLHACVNWLEEVGRLGDIEIKKSNMRSYLKATETMEGAEYHAELARAVAATKVAWREIETSFLPKRAKYG